MEKNREVASSSVKGSPWLKRYINFARVEMHFLGSILLSWNAFASYIVAVLSTFTIGSLAFSPPLQI